jgi:hypothetical protein
VKQRRMNFTLRVVVGCILTVLLVAGCTMPNQSAGTGSSNTSTSQTQSGASADQDCSVCSVLRDTYPVLKDLAWGVLVWLVRTYGPTVAVTLGEALVG